MYLRRRKRSFMTTGIKFASGLAVLLAFFYGPMSSQAEEVEAVSTPSADIMLSFTMTGRLTQFMVKEGDSVKKGQLLALLDDRAERIQVQQFLAQTENKTPIKAAEADLAQKKVDLKKLESARSKGAATDWEIEHARLSLRIAELSLQAAIFEHEQDRRRHAHALIQLERMGLITPIDGRVEKVIAEPGEAVRALGPVIQVVKTDPLWIDVPVPMVQAKQLSLGQKASIRFPGPKEVVVNNGRVIHRAAFADAASDTLRVRIEVPNPDDRPAGERVTVKFLQDNDDGSAGWKDKTLSKLPSAPQR